MTLPADVTLVTVTGEYLTEEGVPATGALIFTPSVATIRDPGDDTMLKVRQQRVELDDTGSFALDLIATDDPDLIPGGWHYEVSERIEGYPQRTWIIQVPSALSSIDISDIPTSVDPSTPTYPAPVFAVTSVVGQIGDVTGTQILADPTVTAAMNAKADTTDLDAYVPYTGAVGDVDLGERQIYGRNLGHFEGALTDPVVTDNGDGTIDVSGIDCMLRSDPDDPDAPRIRVTVPAAESMALTTDATNYLVVDYNDGDPRYELSLSAFDVSLARVPVARMYVESGAITCQLVYGSAGRSTPGRHLYREAMLSEPTGARREAGLGVSETATRVVTVGSGVVWFVLARTELAEITMGDVGVDAELIHHTAGVWTRTPITQYDNSQYDDGTDLVELGNNKYGVNWIFRSIGADHIGVVLGQGSYTLAEAVASGVPAIPQWVTEFCWLAGRIIVEKGADSATVIETNLPGSGFVGATVSDHNALDGLQGGATDEYYHLTAAEYAGISVGYVPYTGAVTDLDLGDNAVYAANLGYTEGLLDDPTITDATATAVAITSVEGIFRADADWGGTDGKLYRKTIQATASLVLTDDAVNYVYAAWNGGSPVYAATTNKYLINGSDLLAVARVAMSGGDIEYQMPYGTLGLGAPTRTYDWIYKTSGRGGVTREMGLAISESALVVTVSAGAAWFGIRRIELAEITNGVDGATMHLWYHTAGVWAETTVATCDNSQYDNGTNLVTLTSNRYAVNWIYRSVVDNEIDIVLGRGDYTLAQAEASTLPAVPEVVSAFHVLVGRVIVQKGSSTATSVESVTTNTFNQGAVSDHEDLSGLQGGTVSEHYHLTATEAAAYGTATSVAAGTPASSGATGAAGQILYDADYLYVCVATDTWERVALSTW